MAVYSEYLLWRTAITKLFFYLLLIFSLVSFLIFSNSRLLSLEENSQLWGGAWPRQDKREDASAQRWPAARWNHNQHQHPQQERHWWIGNWNTTLPSLDNPHHLSHSPQLLSLAVSLSLSSSVSSAEAACPSSARPQPGSEWKQTHQWIKTKGAPVLGKHYTAAQEKTNIWLFYLLKIKPIRYIVL